ncbi:beta-glucosidase family protein [Microbacterium kyungheense]|uniref:Beta-glucosidase n=1 Tax=Microbacterium kyungheense TaxID=1263636 RepID=A0A543EPY1_9MICO|nr:glycoside hydrolase family 3 C-terminal domain-containing protein [Microbacterium kyungheense]TQM23647.1 beta-glucosidase [Microbacterium kyungheense]
MTLSAQDRHPHTRRRRRLTALLLGGALAASGAVVAVGAPAAAVDCSTVPWMDASKSADERAQALLDASSQHQKYRWLVEQPATQPTQTTWQPGIAGEAPVVYPAQVDCTPTIVYTDGPEGVRTSGVTDFPSQIALASTWNLDLAYEKGVAEADEAFAKRRNVVLGPGIGNGRTPLAGRTPEYFGEDPLVNGLFAASQAEGLEADGRVVSDLKHFLANEQELDRQTSSSNVGERALHELYGLPYEIALDHSDPESVMCAFNQVNSVYICESPLMKDLLKGDAGFDGFIMSDFGSVHSTAASLMNGLDQELNRPIWFTPTKLDAALAAGQITQARIDEAAFRVVRSYIRGGLFDNPLPATAAVEASTPQHEAVAREISEAGSVLLKNDGVLPLAPAAGQTIALFGPTASSTVTTVGGVATSAVSVCSLTLQFRPTFPPSNTLPCEDVVSAETALTARAAQAGATVTWNNGQDVAAAAAQAAAADVAVVFGYQRMGEFNDLTNLHLQGNGDALISAVEQVNPNTVVVLQTGSAVEMPWVDGVQAVLENWYGGEQQGPAIASLLFGDVAPSGKLPMTFPVSLADTPTSTAAQYPGVFSDGSTTRPAGSSEIRQVDYSEDLAVGYKWYQSQGIAPLFAFGHGLTYTTFSYDKVKVTPQSTNGAKEVRISFRLTNTGDRTATETAQAYVMLPASTGTPGSRLVGWKAVTLAPGEHANVTIALSADDLAGMHLLQHWDATGDAWVTTRGTYGVAVGGSSEAPVTAQFTVK